MFSPVKKFILEGTEPREEPDTLKWARWFEHADRQIELTNVSPLVSVSTIFVGLHHVLFETLIQGGPYSGEAFRAATWQEAEACHVRAVAQCREAEADIPMSGWVVDKPAEA